jgi:uncharacterized oligopeptide transporter (OPT) family protein
MKALQTINFVCVVCTACCNFLCLKILSICLNLTGIVGSLNASHANARIAQLVEHDLAKVGVAGSSPVSRSTVLHVVLAINFSFRRSSCMYCNML